jgi:hypothetical protein
MMIRKNDKKQTTNHRLSAKSTGRSPIRWVLSVILITIALHGSMAMPKVKYFKSGFTNTRTHVIIGSKNRSN